MTRLSLAEKITCAGDRDNMKDEHVDRKLVAILAADVVGYSRMMSTDEAATLAALNLHLECAPWGGH